MSDPVEPRAQRYADERTTQFSGATAAASEWTTANTRWPGMMAGLAEARLLEALIVAGGAQRVLEIGTFTGVGALSMAAAVGPGGRVITLEVDEERAADARRHFDASPYADRIELIAGDAMTTLERLDGPFDLVWIDAWKADYVAYWDAVVPKLSERGVVVADNLFRDGEAFDESATDDGTVGIRAFAERVHADDRFDNVLLTVGDGVMLAWRRPAAA